MENLIFVGKQMKMVLKEGQDNMFAGDRPKTKKRYVVARRVFLYVVVLPVFLCCLGILFCNYRISTYAEEKVFDDTVSIPYNKVGLLLGTSPRVRGGRTNPYFMNRIEAAVTLYRAGKIKYILISGDNRRHNYNEPQAMKDSLLKKGIPKEALILDFAGLRTLDSVVRSREIFGQDSVTVISQQFHNERAIFLARHYGITAVGFNARDVGADEGMKTRVRELFARVKVYVDFLMGVQPRHLGDRIEIPD